MSDLSEKLSELQARLDNLVKYQEYFHQEIGRLKAEIGALKISAPPAENQAGASFSGAQSPPAIAATANKGTPGSDTRVQDETQTRRFGAARESGYPAARATVNQPSSANKINHVKSDVEKFIGQNLISIIGILILILGIGSGARYAIDNDLISPSVRILLGYLAGSGLLALAFRLKQNYHNFSAVLLSGATAILYFITYFAGGFYNLIPKSAAFLLMLLLTGFTVAAAVNFNRKIIAHVGLVGAYAVPFLLGGDQSDAAFLLGYVALVNTGILSVSLKTYWKSLFYSAFVFTWLIYAAQHLTAFKAAQDSILSFTFLAVFFGIFYATFLAYKIRFKEKLAAENVALILSNSFIFYGFGCAILNQQPNNLWLASWFTFANAVLHFAVAMILRRLTLALPSVTNFLIVVALIFLTITVPVQLKADWTTLLWTAEAALLFWFGRSSREPVYENFSYPLMILAAAGLMFDWRKDYFLGDATPAFFNQTFCTAIFFVAAFAFIHFYNRRAKSGSALPEPLAKIANRAIPIVLLFALYNAFREEIKNYWDFRFINSRIQLESSSIWDYDAIAFATIWQINYTLLFLAALNFVNVRRFRNAVLGFAGIGFSLLILIVFLNFGLFCLSQLRDSYLNQTNAEFFARGSINLIIRYISLAAVAALIFSARVLVKQDFLRGKFSGENLMMAFEAVFYSSLLWLASSELLNLASVFRLAAADRLGLSILWGVYSVMLIGIGIARAKKHLRVAAIFLFAVTLAKVFFYDIAELGTISRTIGFVSLGVLLLVISFLYNKYKNLIFGVEELG